MTERSGWEIICPDGVRRHYPYGNFGDAEFDASLYQDKPERCVGCPGGAHTVEPITFTLPAPPGIA